MILLLLAVILAEDPPSWTEPVEPFRIIGNVHYVGTAELASYLITTDTGHVLLDVPIEANVPHIVRSIETLGFDPDDIRIIINSHAHYDHAGGIEAMRKRTGARVLMSAPDAELAARGGRRDFAFGDRFLYTPFVADEIIHEGTTVSMGGTTLTALMTPGHTKGGTSWVTEVEEGRKIYRVVFANSMTAPTYKLVGNDQYPNIMDDFRKSFARLRALEADVFLAPHASFFNLKKKNFVDREALRRYADRIEAGVMRQYEEQKKTSGD
jgi:metallo-beta-lactamase class B